MFTRLFVFISLVLVVKCLPIEVKAPDHPANEQQETPEETFQRSDLNGDKKLSFDEFLHTDQLFEQLKREEFSGLDANHDGVVSKGEYDSHFQKEKESNDDAKAEYFGQIFDEFDENFDLKLSQAELQKVLEKRFLLKPRANFPQIFKSFDENNDGVLSLDEYVKLDADLPFQEFDPIQKPGTPVAQTPVVNDSNDQSPILAFKTEKLPLAKNKFSEKFW
ncbi:EF-hand domain pair domain-containing protein [Ditylenchus destructor]|uniref:EF-hand domain pair domain-containing protein n=1 Tax=Ditylenchus destructor TaxID=166010 RepID=A0AAD4N954_9BILA|nr:EF-hand domain pair domain-containing protein [Ditylenchus destructor]